MSVGATLLLSPSAEAGSMLAALGSVPGPTHLVVCQSGTTITDQALERLVAACRAPMAASASPVPSLAAPADGVRIVHEHVSLPPPATVGVPCTHMCVLVADAVRSVEPPEPIAGETVGELVARLGVRLVEAGWRHVVAPATALAWDPGKDAAGVTARWGKDVLSVVSGPANEALSTHRSWVDYQLRGPQVLVDGACLTDAPHNGSQKLVLHVARSLKHVRPDASIRLAVPDEFVEHHDRHLRADGIAVVARRPGPPSADIVYRPYQAIDPGELEWLAGAGDRLLLGQLDMIGFSNPAYHPSPALFHAVRNLQRHMLRIADGVVFISEFARSVTLAECPDLEERRLFVVSCGTESEPVVGADHESDRPDDFILCLGATFWHKNRQHALRVFIELCERHGYAGSLVIAGPEPYYGRSAEVERRLLASAPIDVTDRVLYVGQVGEAAKWRLLTDARAVLYPSVVEGFGLVPFEAAAVGTPSISYAGSALAELLDDAPCLASTWRVDEWVELVNGLLTDATRVDAALDAVRRAGAFRTWDHVAELTWRAIDATMARPVARPNHEEAGWASRSAPPAIALARGARAIHFANRARAAARRRLGRGPDL